MSTKSAGAVFQEPHPVVRIGKGRHADDADLFRIVDTPHRLQEGEAVLVRHEIVGQHQLDVLVVLEDLQGFIGRARLVDLVEVLGHDSRYRVALYPGIVEDQDADLRVLGQLADQVGDIVQAAGRILEHIVDDALFQHLAAGLRRQSGW